MDITTFAFLRVLDETRNCVTNMFTAWSTERECDRELLEALIPHSANRNFNSAMYWMFTRLGRFFAVTGPQFASYTELIYYGSCPVYETQTDPVFPKTGFPVGGQFWLTSWFSDLGAALATDTNMKAPLPPSPPYVVEDTFGSDPFARVFCFAHRPLWLCARAVEFMHDEEPSPRRPSLHAWMHLVGELEQWYQERPQGFQPMLELEEDDQDCELGQDFPVVLFANGAGVFANQLYHTAMLLLLHSRPRTAPMAGFNYAAMSPLRHAQRICSIALNNERRECWDPCLLASFLVAARRMTHESQQQEILRGFERIQNVTGWDVSGLLHGLQAEWEVPQG